VDSLIGRLLTIGTWAAIAVILAGVAAMLLAGIDPLGVATAPGFILASIPADLVALRPEGFLWAGLLLVISLPVARVAVAGLGFFLAGERRLAAVSAAVLLVILFSVLAAVGLEG
jgi:uncharacterized membrane protein